MWILREILEKDCLLGIWKIEEEENFFIGSFPIDEERLAKISNPAKRLEFLAARYVAAQLSEVPHEALVLNKENRAPYFAHLDYSLSISHCKGYVAALLHKKGKAVGLDIEMGSEKIARVAERFIEEKELPPHQQQDTLLAQTLCWSIKEAVFKCFDIPGITFKSELRIQSWQEETASIAIQHSRLQQTATVHYRVVADTLGLVLAYTVQ
ncbi:MAG: hypothetical protein RL138_20 [Bacteroidota bacterium]